jgi:recombinational DNA repair protein RecR
MNRKLKSRQALWQAARKARELCCQCGKRPLATKNHCRPCADASKDRVLRLYHQRRGALTIVGGEQC